MTDAARPAVEQGTHAPHPFAPRSAKAASVIGHVERLRPGRRQITGGMRDD